MNRFSSCVLLACAVTAPAVLGAADAPSTSPAAANPASTLRPEEQSFLISEIESGRAAAESARLAVSQATAAGVREFAQQIVADYTQINNTLETLARRKAVAVPLAPTSYSDGYRQLATETGPAFDRAYIRQTAVRAQRALRACETAVAEAKDADIRDLAGSLLPVLRDHVNKITELEQSL